MPWVQLAGLPSGREWSGLDLAVADDAGDDQAGVVESGAEGVPKRIAERAALVDRAGRGRSDMLSLAEICSDNRDQLCSGPSFVFRRRL